MIDIIITVLIEYIYDNLKQLGALIETGSYNLGVAKNLWEINVRNIPLLWYSRQYLHVITMKGRKKWNRNKKKKLSVWRKNKIIIHRKSLPSFFCKLWEPISDAYKIHSIRQNIWDKWFILFYILIKRKYMYTSSKRFCMFISTIS